MFIADPIISVKINNFKEFRIFKYSIQFNFFFLEIFNMRNEKIKSFF